MNARDGKPADWNYAHGSLLAAAAAKVLGEPEPGTMAFVRCLTSNVVMHLAYDTNFSLDQWEVFRVADVTDTESRTITADLAVELREAKSGQILLLVDTDRAGAGMDGIYNAAQEVSERELFRLAHRAAAGEITRWLSADHRRYAELAVGKARAVGGRATLSRWTVYDFYCRVAASRGHAGGYLHHLGLWPVAGRVGQEDVGDLDISQRFVTQLFDSGTSGLMPAERIATLRLVDASEEQQADLERFVRDETGKPRLDAMAVLSEKRHLWINELQVEDAFDAIQGIELRPWRSTTGRMLKWSGLTQHGDADELPRLTVDPDSTEGTSKLEVRWETRPARLPSGSVHYRVSVLTTTGEDELAYREVVHKATTFEKAVFVSEDFATLPEDAVVPARVVVQALGAETVAPQETEEFEIRFGEPAASDVGVGGKLHRTFAEGLIDLGSREEVARLTALDDARPKDTKGFLLWRSPTKRKGFRVQRPPLIREVEEQWRISGDVVGRWRVKVRASGERVGRPLFVPLARPEGVGAGNWAKMERACQKMRARFSDFGGIGQVYDDGVAGFAEVTEYMRAWTALLYEATDPTLALGNTVEVQSQSGRLIGLIVLPSHPLRVAWHVAYDNLVLHAAFSEKMRPHDVRKEFSVLDGAMFPAMLPGFKSGHTFVFADTLGFHAVGMVPDDDKEPKATVAVLRRALGEKENSKSGAEPRVGTRSADVLGAEIRKYVECHDGCRTLRVHALRAGDGRTVARALGKAAKELDEQGRREGDDGTGERVGRGLSFVLELYPSKRTREAGIVGRFIAECQERRRRRAGTVAEEDQWLLKSLSLPGGVRVPRLRWARKEDAEPTVPAHLAIAFDTFESRVHADNADPRRRPFHAFGLLSFFDREYWGAPEPNWRSAVPTWHEGDKHPGNRTHTDRLMRLQNHIQRLVTQGLGAAEGIPVLRTRISGEKEASLATLHKLADWVVTLDRNAGIEYFDSPNDNKEIYDAYVIDCVPEREDLGCLQLITSTTNLEEVQGLLNKALDRMGLSRSRSNAEFLMNQLKALSGRLAIRLTGRNVPASELIALALVQANCAASVAEDECWTSLRDGFFVPVDDVRDLLPPLDPKTAAPRGTPRPDIIYVTNAPRKGLVFRFIEVKYRRHLRTARSLEVTNAVRKQTASLRKGWFAWYNDATAQSFLAVRRAKLARVLRFYADKARRHDLADERHRVLVAEIDRMVGKGAAYAFVDQPGADLGWVFCPEYTEAEPQRLSPPDDDVGVYLFGPVGFPDLHGRRQPHRPRSRPVPEPPSVPASDESVTAKAGQGADASQNEAPSPHSPGEPAIVLGTDRFVRERVGWKLTVKGNPHLLVAGLPGMGKTTCLLNLCRQMLDHGVRPIVFSYHQDLDEKLEEMVDSIRFVDFDGLGFNPLQTPDRTARLSYLDVAGALRDIFVAIYPGLGDLQGEAIRSAVKESFVREGWAEAGADPAGLQEPPFKHFYEILAAQESPDTGLANLLVRMEELNDYGFFDVGKAHGSLWESADPTVIRIHRTQSDVLQKAFSSLILYGLYKDMFRRGIQDRITHAVVFDEAHRAARLNVIPTMAKECRKYGVSLVLASQEARDFHKSVFSAVANYLVLRLTDADAKALARNVADSRQEKALIDTIKQMRRFRALYFREGKKRPNHVDLLDYTAPL